MSPFAQRQELSRVAASMRRPTPIRAIPMKMVTHKGELLDLVFAWTMASSTRRTMATRPAVSGAFLAQVRVCRGHGSQAIKAGGVRMGVFYDYYRAAN